MKKRKNARAVPFEETRKHHLLETAEDYTELVLDLIELKGEARIGDMAEHMGISHVTALRTVKRLEKNGFLSTSPHQPVLLTPKGESIALFAKGRHKILFDFLIKIGVPKEVAAIDVEGIEHHISHETLQAIQDCFLNA